MPAPRLTRAVASLSAAAILLGTLFAPPALAAEVPAIDPRPAAPPATSSAPAPAGAAGRFVVKFKTGTAGTANARASAYGQAAKASGISVKELRHTARGAAVIQAAGTLTPGESAKALASLRSQANVEYAEPDTFIRQTSTPNDPLYPQQWDLSEDTAGMRVPAAWDTTSGQGMVVAVIDTGITPHSDLAQVLPGYDFISDSAISNDGDGRDSDATDSGDSCNGAISSWHGTHVAGTIGAAANNGKGVAGVAYSAKILPVRVLGTCGGYLSDIADAVVWAAGGTVPGVPVTAAPAKVINMSLGGYDQCGSYFQSALDFAAAQGATVVAAAGNENSPAAGFTPANCNNIITVGATGREGSRAYYSNYGPEVDISAPGGDDTISRGNLILSTWNDGYSVPGGEVYGYMQGTSMAAPHVAGAAALMLSVNPALAPAQVEATLKQTSRPLPGTCDTGGCGTGLADASAAVSAAGSGEQPPASAPIVAGTPSVQGIPAVGSVLTADPGNWTPATAFGYQWRRNGADVAAATGGTYTVTAADLAQPLSVAVTGTSYSSGPVTAISAPTPPIGLGTFAPKKPYVVQTPRLGWMSLTNTYNESWPLGTKFSYAWYRSGDPIAGATGTTYTPTIPDIGHTLTMKVTGSLDGYRTLTVESDPTSPVPANTLPDPGLTVTGTAKVGTSLVALYSDPTWRTSVTRTFQWYRSGVLVSSFQHYDITAADLGKTLVMRLTGTRPGYATVVKESQPFLVTPGTLAGPTPLINGTRKVGYVLTAVPGTWTLGTTLKYQWYRSGVAIAGAAGSRYTLTGADSGKIMRLRVAGFKTGYTTLVKDSGTTSAVAAGTLVAGTPWISGYPRFGYTLAANPRTWTSGTTLRYQWYRSGIAIRGATGRYYRLVWADRYDTIKVRVTGSKAGYTTVAKYSGSTIRIP